MNHLPKKFLQVAQIFTKQSKRNKGHTITQHWTTYGIYIFLHMNLSYEPVTHVKRNIKLSLPFRRPKISMIRSIVDYRVSICPFNVNEYDIANALLFHSATEVSFQ